MAETPDRLIGRAEAAQILGVGRDEFNRLYRSKGFPVMRSIISKQVRYGWVLGEIRQYEKYLNGGGK